MKYKFLYISLLIIGVGYRFYFQFVQPSFNVDEISLGNNLKELSYFKLLMPLKYGQSSPPLFLWIQKTIIKNTLFPFWINIKIISFLVSSLTVFYFYKFITKEKFNNILLIPFIILLFNPFVIYNSLTLKQYTFDLLGIILLVFYFKNVNFKRIAPLFFLIWSLLSNIGTFSCAGYLLYSYVSQYGLYNKSFFKNIFLFFKQNVLIVCSITPYLVYFLWYINQEGAKELKDYMMFYWADSFVPFNKDIFKYILFQIHGFWSYFYNMIEGIGVSLFILAFLPIFYKIYKREKIYLQDEILLCSCVFLVHLSLTILHQYPLSDRLYLYLILLFVLTLTSSSLIFIEKLKIKKTYYSIGVSLICLMGYSQYINYKENDVNSMMSYFELKDIKKIYVTTKTKFAIHEFNDFTENFFKKDILLLEDTNKYFTESVYLVSRVHNKLKPNKTAKEELIVDDLLNKERIVLFKKLKGFNLYQITH